VTDERTTKLREQIGRDRLGPVRHFEVVDLERYQEVLCMLADAERRASEAEHDLAESDIEVQRLVEVFAEAEEPETASVALPEGWTRTADFRGQPQIAGPNAELIGPGYTGPGITAIGATPQALRAYLSILDAEGRS